MGRLPRVVWLVIDGVPHWIVKRFAQRNESLPNLSQALASNMLAPLGVAFPNCQTPPSLVSLWSGISPVQSGVIGYDLPSFEHGETLHFTSAFKSTPAELPWIWERYADAGETIRLCHIPFVDYPRLGPSLASATYGFVSPRHKPQVIHHDQCPNGSDHGQWNIKIRPEGVVAEGWWQLDKGWAQIDLGDWQPRTAGRDVEAFLETVDHFPLLASGLGQALRAGQLGKPLSNNGCGQAERIFASALSVLSARYYEEFLRAAADGSARLVLGYQPGFDMLLHELIGYLDPACAHWSPEAERCVAGFVRAMLAELDAFIGRLKAHIGPEDIGLICSDHGMIPTDHIVRPNVALQELGLLQLDASGQIDVERSACFYHPCEAGFLCIAEGRLPNCSVERLLSALSDHLARAGVSVQFVSSAWRDLPGWKCDMFLQPSAGYQAKAQLHAPLITKSVKTGDHSVSSADPRLDGIVMRLGDFAKGRVWPTGLTVDNILDMVLQGDAAGAASI